MTELHREVCWCLWMTNRKKYLLRLCLGRMSSVVMHSTSSSEGWLLGSVLRMKMYNEDLVPIMMDTEVQLEGHQSTMFKAI